MLWRGRRQSGNVEDRRGKGGLIAGGGIGGIIIALVIYFLGGDSSQLQERINQSPGPQTEQPVANDTLSQYVKVVLADTEDILLVCSLGTVNIMMKQIIMLSDEAGVLI